MLGNHRLIQHIYTQQPHWQVYLNEATLRLTKSKSGRVRLEDAATPDNALTRYRKNTKS